MTAEGMLRRVVVVGASIAGVAAAEQLRRQGFAGSLVLVGDEDRAPYARPPLTKAVRAGTQEAADIVLRPDDRGVEHDIELRTGTRAIGLDLRDRVVVVDGSLAERRFGALCVDGTTVVGAVAVGRPRSVLQIRRMLRADMTVGDVVDGLQSGGGHPVPAASTANP